jgi:hypothetical protein
VTRTQGLLESNERYNPEVGEIEHGEVRTESGRKKYNPKAGEGK